MNYVIFQLLIFFMSVKFSQTICDFSFLKQFYVLQICLFLQDNLYCEIINLQKKALKSH